MACKQSHVEDEELRRGISSSIFLWSARRSRCACAPPPIASGRRTVREVGDSYKGGVTVCKKRQIVGCHHSAVHAGFRERTTRWRRSLASLRECLRHLSAKRGWTARWSNSSKVRTAGCTTSAKKKHGIPTILPYLYLLTLFTIHLGKSSKYPRQKQILNCVGRTPGRLLIFAVWTLHKVDV